MFFTNWIPAVECQLLEVGQSYVKKTYGTSWYHAISSILNVYLSRNVKLSSLPWRLAWRSGIKGGKRMEKNPRRAPRVCQFSSLVVFFWRLLISTECRVRLRCQLWWKRRCGQREGWRERERNGEKATELNVCQQRRRQDGWERGSKCPCGVQRLVLMPFFWGGI